MDLATYFRRNKTKPVSFARQVGVSYESIRRYATGEMVPRAAVAEKIRRLTGGQVRPDDFYRVHGRWIKKGRPARRPEVALRVPS
jgi:hypothetical protein